MSKVKPQVIDDEEHERVHDRVAAVDVAKDAGVVCTRAPHPSRPGARQSATWTVKARMGTVRALGRQLKNGRDRDGDARVHQRLLADQVLRAGGVRAGGQLVPWPTRFSPPGLSLQALILETGRVTDGCGCVRSMMTRVGGWCGSCAGAADPW